LALIKSDCGGVDCCTHVSAEICGCNGVEGNIYRKVDTGAQIKGCQI
jgi:hypothetical protein